MKIVLTIWLAFSLLSAKGQIFKIDTTRHFYYNTLTGEIISHKPTAGLSNNQYNYLTDTIHHDHKSDFNVVGKDTIRNGVYEYFTIKKRLKNKKL